MREGLLRTRNLTVMLPRWLPVLIVDGIELQLAITGGELRKEMAKSSNLQAPLDSRLHQIDLRDEALLLDYSLASEVPPIDDDVLGFGEMRRLAVGDGEDGRG